MDLYSGKEPAVSIVLPTFNRAALIPRAVESVIGQFFTKWELIIVDDGSEDRTFSIIKELRKRDNRIKYFKEPHRGLPLTMNKGIEKSCGKYITFLGSDDEYEKEHLNERVQLLETDERIDFLYGGVEVIGEQFVRDKFNRSRLIHLKDCVLGGTFFGRRNVFIDSGGFKNIDYSEDSEFFERISKRYNCRKVDFPTYIYHRDTPDSICNTIGSS